MTTFWTYVLYLLFALVAAALLARPLLGLVWIREREVGVVVKRLSRTSLPGGRLVALEGEAGYQADTLAPGLHFWLLAVGRTPCSEAPLVVVPPGRDRAGGGQRRRGHTARAASWAKLSACDNFQDAREIPAQQGWRERPSTRLFLPLAPIASTRRFSPRSHR